VTGAELDRQVRGELGTLSRDNATAVARHLVMTARLLGEDPEAAYLHSMAAQRRAGRVGLVREAAGIAAYQVGRYEEALRELRTARRLTGSSEHLPLMADCERGLGRPERAIELAATPEAGQLDRAGQLELLMVCSGARQDLGQPEAAVVMLQVPELQAQPGSGSDDSQVTRARLMSAYADALASAGRTQESRTWLEKAADEDESEVTGAAERLGRYGDEYIVDVLDDGDDGGGDDGGGDGDDGDSDDGGADGGRGLDVDVTGGHLQEGRSAGHRDAAVEAENSDQESDDSSGSQA